MDNEGKANKVFNIIVSSLFPRTYVALMAFFTIVGGLFYGSVAGGVFTLAYTFFVFLGVLLGLIPVYGAFLYNGWFQTWLNTTLPQIFGIHTSGLTWFIYIIGLAFAIVNTVIATIVLAIFVITFVVALLGYD